MDLAIHTEFLWSFPKLMNMNVWGVSVMTFVGLQQSTDSAEMGSVGGGDAGMSQKNGFKKGSNISPSRPTAE